MGLAEFPRPSLRLHVRRGTRKGTAVENPPGLLKKSRESCGYPIGSDDFVVCPCRTDGLARRQARAKARNGAPVQERNRGRAQQCRAGHQKNCGPPPRARRFGLQHRSIELIRRAPPPVTLTLFLAHFRFSIKKDRSRGAHFQFVRDRKDSTILKHSRADLASSAHSARKEYCALLETGRLRRGVPNSSAEEHCRSRASLRTIQLNPVESKAPGKEICGLSRSPKTIATDTLGNAHGRSDSACLNRFLMFSITYASSTVIQNG